MQIRYDSKADIVYLGLGKGKYHISEDISDSIVIDLDKSGKVLGIEILDATENIPAFDPKHLSVQTS